MSALRFGLIGAGRIGKVHARNLARVEGAALAWVADVDAGAAQALARESGAQAADDPRRVFEDKAVRAVLLCSSTDTHARLIEEAAAAGKHVFCEKPLDLDPARARRSIDAARSAGVVLQVGFNRRFDPGFARLRRLAAEGALGHVQLVKLTSRDPSPPPREYVAVSGGLFLDMAIHDFDMARFLAGDEIVEASAAGAVLVDPAIGELGDVDTAVTTLRFAGGALGVIDNSRKAVYGYDQRAEVFGSKGCALAPNVAPTEVAVWDAQGRRREAPHPFFLERYQEAYLAELRAFARCARTGEPAPVDGQDGLRATLAALAAGRSLRERRPVKLSELECPTPR